eukprot:gene9411-biopygen3716
MASEDLNCYTLGVHPIKAFSFPDGYERASFEMHSAIINEAKGCGIVIEYASNLAIATADRRAIAHSHRFRATVYDTRRISYAYTIPSSGAVVCDDVDYMVTGNLRSWC